MAAQPAARKNRPGRKVDQNYPFFPNHLLRAMMAVMAALAFVTLMSALFPLPIHRSN